MGTGLLPRPLRIQRPRRKSGLQLELERKPLQRARGSPADGLPPHQGQAGHREDLHRRHARRHVDDFDGLTNHLEIEAGPHEMEVRADGYATLIKDINVKAGQTTTERLSLKKK